MSHAAMIIALSCLVIAGCPRTEPAEPQAPPTEEPRSDVSKLGSDRDEHGCIPSAGYRWCERTEQCERPWELAKRENLENSVEEFEAWCSGGADEDRDPDEASTLPGDMGDITIFVAKIFETDPYKVPPSKLSDIEIWGTVFEGQLRPIE